MFYVILCSFIMSIMHLVNCILYCVWTTIWRNLPLDTGTSSNGRIPCSGASAALQSSAACSVGRQWSMQRRPGIQCSTYHTIIHSYNHTIKGRLLQFNVVCSTFVSASSPDLSLISTTYRHCNLEYNISWSHPPVPNDNSVYVGASFENSSGQPLGPESRWPCLGKMLN